MARWANPGPAQSQPLNRATVWIFYRLEGNKGSGTLTDKKLFLFLLLLFAELDGHDRSIFSTSHHV